MAQLKGIGERVNLVKRNFHYTNDELGKVCGVSNAAIAKIINGQTKDPSISIIMNIVEKLKVNIDWLLFNTGEMLVEKQTKKSLSPDNINFLKQENENLKLLVEAKGSQIETLNKMISLLETRVDKSKGKLVG